jgi:hypothetical protein
MIINRYRKKPLDIKALYFTNDTYCKALQWLSREGVHPTEKPEGLLIKTLEGEMLLEKGNYLIQGVEGEFYPCRKDIFEKTYYKCNGV